MDGETAIELELMEEDVCGVERRRNGACLTDNCDGRRKKHVATSAPVKVPDWSKLMTVESVESLHNKNAADVVSDGDWEIRWFRLMRSRNGDGGSSVFLGVGRTLKGRDMRRVRARLTLRAPNGLL
ncbi:LOW QUALITY PROTEIN: hypothetical protein N665_1724s0006, partial [Sinapis alba]